MKRFAFVVFAVLVAAVVAYVWVVPDPFDLPTVEDIAMAPEPAPRVKDTSRIATMSNGSSGNELSGEAPEVGVLDLADLPLLSGCGLALQREGEEGYVFADAIPKEQAGVMPGAMMLDGEIVVMERTTADGEPLEYGQYPRQVFDSADNNTRVVVELDFGERTDPEFVSVTSGEITVMMAGRPTVNFRVTGGAGC